MRLIVVAGLPLLALITCGGAYAFFGTDIFAGGQAEIACGMADVARISSGSCATGTAGVTCATISVTMSPSTPSFASDGGTFS